jgi:putative Ca2+/H+ antiporter (TMEM165/GDT1 family)
MDWNVFWSTLGLLFLAELGDKTQLAVIAQVCRYGRPGAVLLGAALALSGVTALGALAGHLVGGLLGGEWLRYLAAGGFLAMGLFLLGEAWRAGRKEKDEACPPGTPSAVASTWRVIGSTLVLLALAEMGDKTQLAVFVRASESQRPWEVFGGATLAMVGLSALGVLGGQGLVRLLPERYLRWLSALAFILMGVLIGVGWL